MNDTGRVRTATVSQVSNPVRSDGNSENQPPSQYSFRVKSAREGQSTRIRTVITPRNDDIPQMEGGQSAMHRRIQSTKFANNNAIMSPRQD